MLSKNRVLSITLLSLLLLTTLPGIVYSGKQQEQAGKPFTIALTGKYPPFNFYSSEGDLVGFDVDVARAIAGELNRELKIITTQWDGILAGLLSGRYDAIIGSMAITPERAEQVNFSDTYYVSGAQLFVHKDDKDIYSNIENLEGERVGVVLGTTFEQYLTKNYPEITVVTFKGESDIYQAMLNERIEGFVTDRLVGMYQIKQGNMPFVGVGDLLYRERMAIPVQKEDTELLNKINAALQKLRNDGTLKGIHDKWFKKESAEEEKEGVAIAMTVETVVRKLGYGFATTLLIAFLSLVFGFILALPTGVILNRSKGFVYIVLRALVDFIRGTPVLIQLFFVYFSAPQIGIKLTSIQSAVFTLSINAAAYMSEVIRAGLMSVDPGQRIAGKALGLTPFQVFRFIVWPQAFRIAIPPLMNSAVALIKDTALISVIAVAEVIREAQSIISVTYDPMKYYFIVAILFFVFTFPLMKLSEKIEKKIKKKGFKGA